MNSRFWQINAVKLYQVRKLTQTATLDRLAIYIQSEYKRKELAFWQTFIVF